jgi:hypothetical protein
LLEWLDAVRAEFFPVDFFWLDFELEDVVLAVLALPAFFLLVPQASETTRDSAAKEAKKLRRFK